MIRYVAGFLFDDEKQRVVLIHKDHGPACVVGKWNAVGGAIRRGETSEQAMRREFQEEAGADVPNWKRFAVLQCDEWSVDFYCAASTALLESARTMEREAIAKVDLSSSVYTITVPNLRWLIPMAQRIKEDNVQYYEIWEG